MKKTLLFIIFVLIFMVGTTWADSSTNEVKIGSFIFLNNTFWKSSRVSIRYLGFESGMIYECWYDQRLGCFDCFTPYDEENGGYSLIIDLPFWGFFQGKWEDYFVADTLRGIASSTLGLGICSEFQVLVMYDEIDYSSMTTLYKQNVSFDEILLCDYYTEPEKEDNASKR